MIEIKKICYCDLCKKEGAKTYKTIVRFHTEQNEGRIVEPYFTLTSIELCEKCAEKAIIINGEGAQGNNRFWLNNRYDEKEAKGKK